MVDDTTLYKAMKIMEQNAGQDVLNMETDSGLVRQVADCRDDGAYAELVRRHGAMVYRVCLRVTHDPTDAEDARQAVFFVLLQKAGAIRSGSSLMSWLHGVARRVSLGVVRERARRMKNEDAFRQTLLHEKGHEKHQSSGHEETADGFDAFHETVAASVPDADREDLFDRLDDELAALPEKLREAVILRFLEDRSQKEAAAIAGCPQGTLARHTKEGLDRLRKQFAKRSVVLAPALLLVLLREEAHAFAPSFSLAISGPDYATSAACAATSNARAMALARGVIKVMFWNKIAWMTASFLCVTAVIGGVYRLAQNKPVVVVENKAEGQTRETPVKAALPPLAKEHDQYSTLTKQSAEGVPQKEPGAALATNEQYVVSQEFLRKLGVKLHIKPIQNDCTISKEIFGLLNINEAEHKALQSALDDAQQRIAELVLAHGSAVTQAETSVVLSITPFQAEGRDVENSLRAKILSILGAARGNLFLALGADNPYWQHMQEFGADDAYIFSYFGQDKQTVCLKDKSNTTIDLESTLETKNHKGVRMVCSHKFDRIPEIYRRFFDGFLGCNTNSTTVKKTPNQQKFLEKPNPHEGCWHFINDQYVVTKLFLQKIGINTIKPFEDNYTISPEIVDLLNITRPECKGLQNAVNEARSSISELDIAQATVISQAETSVTLAINPFKEEGKRVENTLREQIRTALGVDRGSILLAAFRGHDWLFSGFGQSERIVTVSSMDDGRFFIYESYKRGFDQFESFSTTYDELPERFQHFFEKK